MFRDIFVRWDGGLQTNTGLTHLVSKFSDDAKIMSVTVITASLTYHLVKDSLNQKYILLYTKSHSTVSRAKMLNAGSRARMLSHQLKGQDIVSRVKCCVKSQNSVSRV